MKHCRTCGLDKPESEFNKRGSGLQTRCRSCQKEWYQSHKEQHTANVRRRAKAHAIEMVALVNQRKAEAGCTDCGERDPVVLEYDHLGDKIKNISMIVRDGWSLDRLDAEIAKCEVVCANCHRRRTHARRHASMLGSG